MIKEEVVSHSIVVDRIGATIQFQIQLPYDTTRIIGIEHSVNNKTGIHNPFPFFFFGPVGDTQFRVKKNKIIGRLSLRAPGAENQFYQADLIEYRNEHYNERIAAKTWQPQFWTHGRKQQECPLSIEVCNSLVEGSYRDSWGMGEYKSLSYELHLYLWIEKYCK